MKMYLLAVAVVLGVMGLLFYMPANSVYPEVAAQAPAIDRLIRERMDLPCLAAPRLPLSTSADCPACPVLRDLGLIEVGPARGTDSGRWRWTEQGQRRLDLAGSRLCFGRQRLDQLIASTAPRMVFNQRESVVKLRIAVDDPDPLLHEPRLHALGLQAPEPGTITAASAHYAAQCLTFVFHPNGDIDLAHAQVIAGVGFCPRVKI